MSNSNLPSSATGQLKRLVICASLFSAAFTINAQETQFSGTIVDVADSNMVTIETIQGQRIFIKISENASELPSVLLNASVTGSCSMRGDLCISSNLQLTTNQ